MARYDTEQLKLDLGCSARPFCLYLFHNEREHSVGSLKGEPSNGLKIRMIWQKTDVWGISPPVRAAIICSTSCTGYGAEVLGTRKACEEAANWLSNPERYKTESCSVVGREHGYAFEFKQDKRETQNDTPNLSKDKNHVKRKMLYSIDWKLTSLKMQLCRDFNKSLRFFRVYWRFLGRDARIFCCNMWFLLNSLPQTAAMWHISTKDLRFNFELCIFWFLLLSNRSVFKIGPWVLISLFPIRYFMFPFAIF